MQDFSLCNTSEAAWKAELAAKILDQVKADLSNNSVSGWHPDLRSDPKAAGVCK